MDDANFRLVKRRDAETGTEHPSHQEVINALFSISLPRLEDPFSSSYPEETLTLSDILAVISLAVRSYGRGDVELSSSALKQAMGRLLRVNSDEVGATRQEMVLLDLLRVCPCESYDEERILLLAEGALDLLLHTFFVC